MGNLKERESRRRASVVGSIIEQQPAEETKQRSVGRGGRGRIGNCGSG